MRILIVEDEVKIRLGISKLISNATLHRVVAEAKNGREGLELYQRYKPDLIITDIRMPEMDGLEMLSQIKALGGRFHAALLTGYAEFEYAKQAISVGAVDYLLKPIGVEDVTALLEKVEAQLAQEEQESVGVESCLRGMYLGENSSAQAFAELIRSKSNIEEEYQYTIYIGYIGATKADYRERFNRAMTEMKSYFSESIYITFIDKMQEIICFTSMTPEETETFERMFERKIADGIMFRDTMTVWSKSRTKNIGEVGNCLKTAQKGIAYYDCQKEKIVNADELSKLKFEEFIYPGELESEIKMCICNNNVQALEGLFIKFKDYFRKHNFAPEYMQHGYLKLFSFFMNLLQEIDAVSYSQLHNMCVLRQISEARIQIEMENCLDDVRKFLETTQSRKENVGNYMIKRAINYIREHYQDNIGLEDISSRLDITPEYLSSLFNKEVGVNFSTFLKEFRISCAKRLLKGSDMKIYEVAEKVGYSDPKYFMRVFKEVQGVSPKEYRQND